MIPKYPIYIPSKGRAERCLTARFLLRDEVPFKIVVEPQEVDAYAAHWGEKKLLVLPFSNLGLGSIPARNFLWEHAKAAGHARHWCLDDNIQRCRRWYRTKRVPCKAGIALGVTEQFVDRYENIAIGGLNYTMFAIASGYGQPPFYINTHVYSCLLIRCDLPYRWRGRYNEDTDLCLQVLAGGWCTINMNCFLVEKIASMAMKGGNTDVLYKGDGRLKMARSLERAWPRVVKVRRRFQRPQHVVHDAWKKFDTPLIRRKDIDWKALEGKTDEFGMKLVEKKPVKSAAVAALLKEKSKSRKRR